MSNRHIHEPTKGFSLAKLSADIPDGMSKEDAEKQTTELAKELTELQELQFAAGKQALLIVLQGRDTSGKDGTIRHLLQSMNAQATRVTPFKVPTPKELAHDFLWRVHAQTPGRGETVLFNRSHYEDVLVVRVHDLVPKDVWSRRYDRINEFETLLTASDCIVLKFMLHITKDEQEQRLLDREKEVEKAWKLSVGDWKEREFWDAYTEAYAEVLERCSTKVAPWHVVPANSKKYRNFVITEAIVEALRPLSKQWMQDLTGLGEKAKAELAAYRSGRPANQ